MKVLISNPCLHPYSIYPPYLWARFKTYIDCDYDKDISVDWLEPIYEHHAKLPEEDFDILVLSCYVWNYEKNIELARKAKEKNPNLLEEIAQSIQYYNTMKNNEMLSRN